MANTLGLTWELASPFGIEWDEAASVWYSGHVTDVLEIDDGNAGHLVATEKGGVWSVPRLGAATALSNTWENPGVNCLVAGPDGARHFYAGTSGILAGGRRCGPCQY